MSASVVGHLLASQFKTIVLNFIHLKLFNPLPTRLWVKKTGPLEFNLIIMPNKGISQLNRNTIMIEEAIISKTRFENRKTLLFLI
jgi:hypothetical protein